MAYATINPPSGVYANGTNYQGKGRWAQANLVRWHSDAMLPVGGWERVAADTVNGVCRAMFPWRDNSANRYLALGTHLGLFVFSDRGAIEDITPADFTEGRIDAVYGLGFGTADFGAEAFGTPRTGSTRSLDASMWSFDSFGENLLGVNNVDGRLVQWAPEGLNTDPVTAAAVVPEAPLGGLAVVVTPERHAVLLGAGNPRRVTWSDRENLGEWTATSTNLAGEFELQTTGRLLCAVRTRGQTLVLTTADAHAMNFVGNPFVYGFEKVGDNCGPVSTQAIVNVGDFAVWMGTDTWHLYDGTIQNLPSDVWDYVFKDFNEEQGSKVVGGTNPEFDEVWWWYPSKDSLEINRYVVWNYVENHWTVGELQRTAWAAPGVFLKPFAVDVDGVVYRHETGFEADGVPITTQRFVRSGPVEIGQGDRLAVVKQLVPDEGNRGETQVRFTLRNSPNAPATELGPFSLSDYTPLRFTSRQVELTVEGLVDDNWRVGNMRLDVKPGSKR